MCRPSAPEVFGAPKAPSAPSSSRIERATSRTRANGTPSAGLRSRAVQSANSACATRENHRILGNRRELCCIHQRLERSADDLRALRDDADDLAADAGRHVRGPVLIEGRRRDTVGEALHDQRPIGEHRQDRRRDFRVSNGTDRLS